ncbi:hypothetical protein F4819DRAFT_468090 [Hypoxylon fuscum]|nr:hypothetical protein F4819DRAFT_468090 [Hypoxylon fuscum]
MSRFAAYCKWTVTARKCLDGEPPPGYLGEFRLGRWVQFPLKHVEHSTRVASFYKDLFDEVQRSRLDEKRKDLYKKFKDRVISAHVATEEVQVSIGTASRLRIPLAHIHEALIQMTELIEYDANHPVHWHEVFPTENARSQLSPEELWLHFKLESIRPCLVFLVRLLRRILPDRSVMWDECERSLLRAEWIVQFILDSPKTLPPQHPEVIDLLLSQRYLGDLT